MKCSSDIIVSVCPTLRCANSCDFCYLGSRRSCTEELDLDRLRIVLSSLGGKFNITSINVFGGEISTMDINYLMKLKEIVYGFSKNCSFTSNLTNMKIYNVFNRISTSLNYSRPDFEYVLGQIQNHKNTIFDVSVVILDDFLSTTPEDFYSRIPENCKTVTFQKYATSIYNEQRRSITDDDYQQILIRFIDYYIENYQKYHFGISNICDIIDCLDGKYDSSARSNVFILPNGNLHSIDYEGRHEYFREHSNISNFLEFCDNQDMMKLVKCGTCNLYGNCYCEHWNGNEECCGNRGIIVYYKSKKHDLCRILEANKQMQPEM